MSHCTEISCACCHELEEVLNCHILVSNHGLLSCCFQGILQAKNMLPRLCRWQHSTGAGKNSACREGEDLEKGNGVSYTTNIMIRNSIVVVCF